MVLLNTVNHPILTEYVLKLLNKYKIFTVVDFVKTDSHKLGQTTNLTFQEISKIKKDLLTKYGVIPITGLDYYNHRMQNVMVLPTSITGFDELIDGGLVTGNLLEICGLPAAGKTQLVTSIAINYAQNHALETYIIDSKNDFSAIRIHKILENRGCNEHDCGQIMRRIKCERVYEVPDFLEILRNILENIHMHNDFKLLIVDSLPSMWLLLHGETSGDGFSLLTEAANLMRRLAVNHEKIILLVNLTTRWTAMDFGENLTNMGHSKLTTALGKYWQTVPSMRLLIHRASNNVTAPSPTNNTVADPDVGFEQRRLIKILKSNQHKTGKSCLVTLTSKGVL